MTSEYLPHDHLYMRRALELASLGSGTVHPNPMVGTVVVAHGQIIGEGYHHAWGGAHAEVMAIRSVRQPELLAESVLYVTLEPCSHHGKTPPCADLIIRSRIPRVIVAMLDPYPEVAGRGIARLREAGIRVDVGLCETDARRLNKAFLSLHLRYRPWISLKWAESVDGYMDAVRQDSSTPPIVFSSAYRQRVVHRSRLEHQAILVGYRTALLDDPSLTNRYWGMRQPLRLVLDPRAELPQHLCLLSDGLAPTWVLHSVEYLAPIEHAEHVRYLAIDDAQGLAHAVCKVLSQEGITSVLIEGGASTLQAFIDAELYDSLERERSPLVLGRGVPAPCLPEALNMRSL